MKNFDVITTGAILIDIVGKTDRLPKVNQEEFISDAIIEHGGSAANTAVACARLGLKTGFIGKVGNDTFGELLREGLEKEGVDVSHLKMTDKKSTGICVAIYDKKDRRHMYAFSGASNLLEDGDIPEDYVASTKILHIADLLNVKPLIKAAKIASNAGAKVSFNPGGLIASLGYEKAEPLFSLTDVLILSEHDAKRIYGTTNFRRLARTVFKNKTQVLALTLGEKGCILSNRKREAVVPPYKTRVVDTTGAGDAFTAGLLYGILNGFSIEKFGRYANAAAALCISTPGARLKHSVGEVERLIKSQTRLS